MTYQNASTALIQDRLDDCEKYLHQALIVWPEWELGGVEFFPGKWKAYLLSARLNRLQFNFQQASQDLENCRRTHYFNQEILREWMIFRAQVGELGAVEQDLYESVGAEVPDSPWILEGLAMAYMTQYRFKSAEFFLNSLLKLRPDWIRALDWRGWVREKLESFELAYEDYNQALGLDPNRWKVRIRLLNMLLVEKKMKEAKSHLDFLDENGPEKPEINLAFGRYWMTKGNFAKAKSYFAEAYKFLSKDIRTLIGLGQVELELGNPELAEKFFRKSIDLDSFNPESRYGLYRSLVQQEKETEAKKQKNIFEKDQKVFKEFKKLLVKIEISPKDAGLLTQAGEILIAKSGDSQKAGEQFLYRALQASPGFQKAHQLLADYFEKKGMPEEAKKHREALKK